MCLNRKHVLWECHGDSVWYIVFFLWESDSWVFFGHVQFEEIAFLLFVCHILSYLVRKTHIRRPGRAAGRDGRVPDSSQTALGCKKLPQRDPN